MTKTAAKNTKPSAPVAKKDDFVEIEIESGLTPPSKMSGYVKNWPLEKLQVGQSFFIPLEDGQKEGSMRHALYTLCDRRGLEHNRNYRPFKASKNEKEGFRLFRLEGEYQGPADEESESEKQAA